MSWPDYCPHPPPTRSERSWRLPRLHIHSHRQASFQSLPTRRVIPVDDPGGALHIGGDEDFHSTFLGWNSGSVEISVITT